MASLQTRIERVPWLLTLARVLNTPWKFTRQYPVIPLAILTGLIVLGVFAPVLAPRDPLRGNIRERFIPPAWSEEGSYEHFLGTDHTGRDIWSRIMYGARISLMVVAISLSSGFLIGTTLGVMAGYLGGWWDEIIMRFVDIAYAIPFLMIALVVVIIWGESLTVVFFLLGILAWRGFVRIVRANTLVIKEMDYISLARVAGASTFRIVARHVLPMVINAAIVVATLNVGYLILTEATLSFLGAGIPAPTPAWGTMVAEGRNYISSSWWEAFFPGMAIFLVVLSLNFFGDWLRDRMDPRLRQNIQ